MHSSAELCLKSGSRGPFGALDRTHAPSKRLRPKPLRPVEDINRLAQTQPEEWIAFHERLCGLFRVGMDEPESPLRRILRLGAKSAASDDRAVLGRDIGQMLVNMALPQVQTLWIIA